MKFKPKATPQFMTQQEDRVPEKPKNPISDILKRQKGQHYFTRKASESNTTANKSTTAEQFQALNFNKEKAI